MFEPPALPYALAPLSLAPVALVLGYAAAVLLARRTQWFDLTFHVFMLLLMGVALGAGGPARALATALLATILAASALALMLRTGPRSPGERDRLPFANRTATLRRPLGPPKPSVAR
jgi:hypothetical protein